uniref:Knottin scorpion toxin-like domain-containing protein n=1 Tax=Oryza barthii TaxID=65489 RepID=A0A0D3GLD7_9ORYZ
MHGNQQEEEDNMSWGCLLLLLLMMIVSASSSATMIVISPSNSSSAAAAGRGRRMEEYGSGGCSVKSKTWNERKLCTKRGTCNVPCRAEGFDYGSCYPNRPRPSFIGRFFHVCYCSMNYCKNNIIPSS